MAFGETRHKYVMVSVLPKIYNNSLLNKVFNFDHNATNKSLKGHEQLEKRINKKIQKESIKYPEYNIVGLKLDIEFSA